MKEIYYVFLGCERYKYFAIVLQTILLWNNSQLQSESNEREKQKITYNN